MFEGLVRVMPYVRMLSAIDWNGKAMMPLAMNGYDHSTLPRITSTVI